jgi:hypothetical protein
VSKDRAAPFSRKHRRYWIPVTGGMLLIGVTNIVIGYCTYEAPRATQRIELTLPARDAAVSVDGAGTIGIGELPVEVLRAFAIKYPKTIAVGALIEAGDYIVLFAPGAPHQRAAFRADGTFVSEQ